MSLRNVLLLYSFDNDYAIIMITNGKLSKMRSNSIINYIPVGMVSITMLAGATLVITNVKADDVVDQVNITVPVSCSMTGTGMDSHIDEVPNGTYQADIGTTTLHAFCNDSEGFAIYAAGFTGNEVGGENSNKLVGTPAGIGNIATGIATSGNTSNWSMKLAIIQDSGDTTGTNAFVIDSDTEGSFGSYHTVPAEYTKVAHKGAATDMTANTGGVKLTTTYAAYISKNQPAGTYAGQVKYTLIHPSSAVAGKLNLVYDANGLTFANGKSTNLVAYDAVEEETTGIVTKKSYANAYNEEGGYSISTIGAPVGNRVVTIDGAESIHIAVTYGAPQYNSGPPSDLYIFAGNHPEYTNSNSSDALASCGSTSSVNGAFSSNGGGGTQVTMECDIASDSVTFYDYSANTNNNASMGYYAVITGQGTITSYDKTTTSGAYSAPTVRIGQDVFLGWSTNPNANADAEEPMYADESAVITNAPYTNDDHTVTLYAVWGKTFNAAYNDAGKAQLSGHYKMQDATDSTCKEIYVGATETLIDTRDNTTYMAGRLKDGKCWMLDNLALDPTEPTTAANINEGNTNATAAAINNLLNGGSTTAGWSNTAVVDVDTDFCDQANSYIGGYKTPRINNASKDTLVTSYGPASANGQAKVGIYYNFCAASASTYCYEEGQGVNVPDTLIDAPQDICPANWRMPTGGNTGEYYALAQKYTNTATDTNSLQYNLSTPLSGHYDSSSADYQGSYGGWWSSTYNGSNGMYYLFVSPTAVSPDSSYVRNRGRSMRCLMSE